MTYEKAKELARKSDEVAFTIIEEAVRDMPQEEFLKIPVIDEYTKVAAQRYGWCFTSIRSGDYSKYHQCYMFGMYVMRDEKETILK